ncbi:MAG: hypothetical protein KAS32_12805 [Candidatus Peribacteraceae bacterium]|nr:hypothetical protein [Candidatus Peribacteraceae bacterium]
MKVQLSVQIGKPNRNGLIYPESVVRKALDNKMGSPIIVCIGESLTYHISNAAAKIVGYEFVDKIDSDVTVDMKIMNTIAGQSILDILSSMRMDSVRLIMVGMGTVTDNIVNDNFRLSHFNIKYV